MYPSTLTCTQCWRVSVGITGFTLGKNYSHANIPPCVHEFRGLPKETEFTQFAKTKGGLEKSVASSYEKHCSEIIQLCKHRTTLTFSTDQSTVFKIFVAVSRGETLYKMFQFEVMVWQSLIHYAEYSCFIDLKRYLKSPQLVFALLFLECSSQRYQFERSIR